MRNPFARMFRRLSVDACPNCEGGSGAFYNAESGELTCCRVCAGTGLDAAATPGGAPIVDLAHARSARAKEQRRVA